MKRVLAIMICLIVVISLTACTDKVEEKELASTDISNPFEQGTEDNIRYEYSLGLVSAEPSIENSEDDLKILYKGNPINLTVGVESIEGNFEIGILVLLNGIPQDYILDNNKTSMSKVNLKTKENKDLQISFTPNTGEKGETLSLQILGIFNPSYLPKGDERKQIMGFNDNFIQCIPFKLEMYEDIENRKTAVNYNYKSVAFTDEILLKYKKASSIAPQTSLLDDNTFFLISESNAEEITSLKSNNGVIKTRLELLGGEETDYIISVFQNNQIVNCFDGKPFARIKNKKGCTNIIDIEFNSLSKDTSRLYAIAVPIDKDFNVVFNSSVEKSQSVVID